MTHCYHVTIRQNGDRWQAHCPALAGRGARYRDGQGVPQDDTEAVGWWHKAAEQGMADAQYNLGFMYAIGEGVPQNSVQAHVWINLAVLKRLPGESRDKAVEVRDIVAKTMTPAQISEAQKLAREWKPKK